MSQLNISVDTADLEVALATLSKTARVAPGVVIKEETRLLVKNIIQLTPPKTNAQGRKAVMGDLNRVVYPLHADDITWPKLKEAVQQKDEARLIKLLANKRTPRFEYTNSAARIEQEHKRVRNRRGRVPKGTKPRIAALRTLTNKYRRAIQKRVGWHSSLFVAALQAAGGRAPNWISRNAPQSSLATYHFGENPFISATGKNAKIPNFQRVVDNAVANRERTTMTKIERLVSGKAVNLGFAKVKL